jgi:drug/metabolite transporter (DMT)-like permease
VTPRDALELITLAALWGASFLFMKVAVPEFGVVPLVGLRCALAVLMLAPLLSLQGLWPELRQHWKPIAVVGLTNSALPFIAFNYAALYITAGLSSIFNATAPLWATVVAWLWLREKPGGARALGLAVGMAGVAWLSWDKASFKPDAAGTVTGFAVLACVGATLLYGIGANFVKVKLKGVTPMAVAAGSQIAVTLVLLVPTLWWWPAVTPSAPAWGSAALLGVLCTGLAYVIFFRLIARLGPTSAISVTFLIPLFGVSWGSLLLGERITPVMLGAGLVIVLGTALTTGVLRWPRR